jgi:Predicted transcriptional regulators
MLRADLDVFGACIRKWRKTRKMTLEELSEKCGISTRHLINLEHGRINVSFDMIYALVHTLDISADYLFFPEMDDVDKRTKLMLSRFSACSAKNQEIILELVGCLIYNLQKAND